MPVYAKLTHCFSLNIHSMMLPPDGSDGNGVFRDVCDAIFPATDCMQGKKLHLEHLFAMSTK